MQIPLQGLGDCNKDDHISRGTGVSYTLLQGFHTLFTQHVIYADPNEQVLYIY